MDAGGMPPAPPADELEELDEEPDDDEEEPALVVAVVGELAVLVVLSLPSSRNRATPIAARTTTPAMIRAISVFLLPFGCWPPDPAPHGAGWP
jgi:hypothetical protein